MVYHKLEEDIKKALKGKQYGSNVVLVRTDNLGNVEVEEFDEDDYIIHKSDDDDDDDDDCF